MWLSAKESACQCKRCRFDPWVRKIPWRRKWKPTPVFLPGNSHGQRILAGYSPRDHKEPDRIWQLSTHKLDYTISKSFSGSELHCVCFKVEAMRNQEAPSRSAGSSYSCLGSAPTACGE